MEVAVKKIKNEYCRPSKARIEVAASEISAAHGISITIISYISLGAISFLPSLLDQTPTQIKNGCFNSK